MIYVHSLGHAVRYYGDRAAISGDEERLTYREPNIRVERVAAALHRRGLRTGDRLAVVLPNRLAYIELVYACSRLGLIVVLLDTRCSSREIDRIIEETTPRETGFLTG